MRLNSTKKELKEEFNSLNEKMVKSQNENQDLSPFARIKKVSEDLMAQILSQFPQMVQEIESILKEICNRLKPEPEEEITATFHLAR